MREYHQIYSTQNNYVSTAWLQNISLNISLIILPYLYSTNPSSWRDMKVVNDHAYIVSEASDHGMQVRITRKAIMVFSPF